MIGRNRDALAAALREFARAVSPRRHYSLVHGELGPEHVLVDAAGNAVLIDVEGLMFADPEWDHAYLAMRFEQYSRFLAVPGLDQHRLRLYALALHLSLIAGPLRLLDGGDYPDRAFMLEIATHHTDRTLSFLNSG